MRRERFQLLPSIPDPWEKYLVHSGVQSMFSLSVLMGNRSSDAPQRGECRWWWPHVHDSPTNEAIFHLKSLNMFTFSKHVTFSFHFCILTKMPFFILDLPSHRAPFAMTHAPTHQHGWGSSTIDYIVQLSFMYRSVFMCQFSRGRKVLRSGGLNHVNLRVHRVHP
jgi:hypothetical protein